MSFCNLYNYIMLKFDKHVTRMLEGRETTDDKDFKPRTEVNIFWGLFILTVVAILFTFVSIFYILYSIIKTLTNFSNSKSSQISRITTSKATKTPKHPLNENIVEDDILWK